MSTDNPSGPRRRWRMALSAVQMLALAVFLVTALGASGMFVLGMCPVCPQPRPDYTPVKPLPEELEKGTGIAK